jgi:predicted MFS family arabinose efflux permease
VNLTADLTRWAMTRIFLAFACAYFFSALLRAVTATLAPSFSAELGLQAADLGLLAGSYFLGFSLMQLPLGAALDRVGPKRVLLTLTGFAVIGCAAFALAGDLLSLALARALIGVGVAAGLMAPLTCYRLRFSPQAQLRANSWMLMTGSLGMVASTLPVQWLLPVWGWRGLFWAVAACLLACMLLMWRWVPADAPPATGTPQAGVGRLGYRQVVTHPVFLRSAPIGFFLYGGLIAVQSLWAGPWLTRVAGWQPQEAASGLFLINVGMLLAFMSWGAVMPRLVSRGIQPDVLIARGLPINLLLLAWIVFNPEPAGALTWTLWCVSTTFVSLSQPAVAQAFAAALAGRALSAFNLVIFLGVFAVQWGIGLTIDGFRAAGHSDGLAFRAAFGIFGLACVLSYLWFLWAHPQRRRRGTAAVQ